MLALIALSASPSQAGTGTGSGQFGAQADPGVYLHVGCGIWGIRIDTNAAGYYWHLKSSTRTKDGTYPTCPDDFGLPASRSKTRARGFFLDNGTWALGAQLSLNGNASGSSYVASEYSAVNMAQGYWYPEGGHDMTLWFNAYYQSGGSGMAEFYDNPNT